MSTKGIYTALSGAIAQSQKLDTIANNIANSDTTAFKKDAQTFREYLTAYEKQPDVMQVPKIPASVESFYHMQGGDKSFVDTSGTFTSFQQGHLKQTGNKLDMALEGQGFFEVLSDEGIRLTRNGAFKMDSLGRLVNSSGQPVLRAGNPGEPPENRFINLKAVNNVTVTYDGALYENGEPLAQVSIVDVGNKDALQKVGAHNYKLKPNYNETLFNSQARVHQGYVEGSNVNIIKEMTDMIATTRTFESTQKAIRAFDEMNQKLMNDVPKLR